MIHSYLINLDRSIARRADAERQWQALGIAFERVAGVDGAALKPSALEAFASSTCRARWLPGQIGCLMSHLAVWRRIVAGGDEVAAVFEDDNVVSPDLGAFLADGSWVPVGADIVRLETTGHGVRMRECSKLQGRSIASVGSPSWGAGAYVLRRDTAAWLVRTPARWFLPVDRMLFDMRSSALARALRIYQVSPALCVQRKFHPQRHAVEQFESLIDGPGFDPHRMPRWRTLLRPVARSALGLKPVPFA